MTEKQEPPMTKEELEVLFQDKNCEMGSELEYLNSCNVYLSKEACDAVYYIQHTIWLLGNDEDYKKISGRLIDVMLEKGLAQLMLKIVKCCGQVDSEVRFQACLMLSNLRMLSTKLAQHVRIELCKSGIIRPLVKELHSYDPFAKDTTQRLLINSCLCDLNNLLRAPNVVPIYRSFNAVDVVMKFAAADDITTKVISLRVLAQLLNEKESQRLATSGDYMKKMLDIVRRAALTEDKQCNFDTTGDDEQDPKFSISLRAQVALINDLVSSDTNKEAIVQHGGVPILTSILKPEYEDDVKQEVVEALWKLSYQESCLDEVITHLTFTDTQSLEALKEMRSSANPKIRDASQGLLHQLNVVDIHDEPPVEKQRRRSPSRSPPRPAAIASHSESPPSYQKTMEATHVMISYRWDQQQKAIRVRDKLTRKGFHIWMDVDKVEGNILVSMANAVENAAAILVCVSRSYKASVNCQAEAHYAYQRQKPIIPLNVEEDYVPDGWLGMITAMKKYIRAYSDEVLDKDMPDLLRELGNRGRAV